ncbi:MAG: RimK/LysX family protein, partial [Oceanococcaceae bacterium]
RDGAKWVRFQLRLTDAEDRLHDLMIERPRVRRVRIKEHEGEYDRRPVIEMRFCLGGEVHQAEFTLADRGRFVYPVLLGRRFLADFAPVDSRKTFTRQAACPATTPAHP